MAPIGRVTLLDTALVLPHEGLALSGVALAFLNMARFWLRLRDCRESFGKAQGASGRALGELRELPGKLPEQARELPGKPQELPGKPRELPEPLILGERLLGLVKWGRFHKASKERGFCLQITISSMHYASGAAGTVDFRLAALGSSKVDEGAKGCQGALGVP